MLMVACRGYREWDSHRETIPPTKDRAHILSFQSSGPSVDGVSQLLTAICQNYSQVSGGCTLLWKWMPASGWFWARSWRQCQVFLSCSAATVSLSETLSQLLRANLLTLGSLSAGLWSWLTVNSLRLPKERRIRYHSHQAYALLRWWLYSAYPLITAVHL